MNVFRSLRTVSVFVLLLLLGSCAPPQNQVAAPAIRSFGATPPSIVAGGSSNLSWEVVRAQGATVTLTPGVGEVEAEGSTTVTPTEPTTYTLTVTKGGSSVTEEATVQVTRAPTAGDQSVTTAEDTPVAITLAGNDADGDALTFEIVDAPTNGSLSGTAPDLTYTPNPDFSGSDAFTFRSDDGTGEGLTSDPATVSITVTAVNDAPLADDQSVSTFDNEAVAVTLTGSDADGDALTFAVVVPPQNGTLTGTGAQQTYTPDLDYVGADAFTFLVTDGEEVSATATVSITVASSVLWTHQFGTDSTDWLRGGAVDGSGNTLVTGVTYGSLAAAADVGGDVFVRKVDPDGTELWTRQFGTIGSDIGTSLAVDGSGNVLVVGSTDWDLEGATAGSNDVFVRKYDPDGTELWTRQFGTSDSDYGYGVAADGSGNVLVTGFTGGSLAGATAGLGDVFVRKYDPDGTELWTRQFGTSSRDRGYDVAVDGAGNVLVTGYTEGDLEGSNAGPSESDAFVRKYDPDGTELWTRQFGTSSYDFIEGLAVDGAGNVLVTGRTGGNLEGTTSGNDDAFVRKYDADGVEVWTRQFGTGVDEYAEAVAVDAAGNVLAAGYTEGSLEGVSTGDDDAFVRKYDADGVEVWTRQFGTGNGDYGYVVAVDAAGNVLLAGDTYGDLEGTSAGTSDGFVRKYAP